MVGNHSWLGEVGSVRESAMLLRAIGEVVRASWSTEQSRSIGAMNYWL